jgi:uncharacterized protein YyaL (SSP411 family)
MLDDYAAFGHALLDLYETTFSSHWLERAIRITDALTGKFADDAGGFFTTDGADSSVLVRLKDEYDGAEPSGNSMATLLLLRTSDLLGREADRDRAEKTLRRFGRRLHDSPEAVPQMLVALDRFLNPTPQIVIVGERARADTRELVGAVHRSFLPARTLVMAAEPADTDLERLIPWLAEVRSQGGRSAAMVCENHACQLPVTSGPELEQRLKEWGGRGTLCP